MIEKKYNTKDIRHINEKSQEYIAEGNRMTKEIIIDGVNVTRCCCYENGKCLWTKRYYENNIAPVCEKVKDCYYKQLVHLKQQHNDDTEEIAKLGLDVAILEQENKALQAYKDINEDFKKAWDELNEKHKQLRSVLEEIREDIRSFYGCEDSSNDYKLVNMIDKINEVLQ